MPGRRFKGARLTQSANSSILTGVTTTIGWDTEVFDTDNIYVTTANTRLTVPSSVERVSVAFGGTFAANPVGSREFRIDKNGAFVVADTRSNTGGIDTNCHVITGPINVSGNDYFEARVFQNSTGNLLFKVATAFFTMEILD